MSTPHNKALESFSEGDPNESIEAFSARKKAERKAMLSGMHKRGQFVSKAAHKRHNPGKKPEVTHYKTDTANAPPPKKDPYGWAGRVGQAHLRNQKAEHEKGYREDYR